MRTKAAATPAAWGRPLLTRRSPSEFLPPSKRRLAATAAADADCCMQDVVTLTTPTAAAVAAAPDKAQLHAPLSLAQLLAQLQDAPLPLPAHSDHLVGWAGLAYGTAESTAKAVPVCQLLLQHTDSLLAHLERCTEGGDLSQLQSAHFCVLTVLEVLKLPGVRADLTAPQLASLQQQLEAAHARFLAGPAPAPAPPAGATNTADPPTASDAEPASAGTAQEGEAEQAQQQAAVLTLGRLCKLLVQQGGHTAAQAVSRLVPLRDMARQLHGDGVLTDAVPVAELLPHLHKLPAQLVAGNKARATVMSYISHMRALLVFEPVARLFASPGEVEQLCSVLQAAMATHKQPGVLPPGRHALGAPGGSAALRPVVLPGSHPSAAAAAATEPRARPAPLVLVLESPAATAGAAASIIGGRCCDTLGQLRQLMARNGKRSAATVGSLMRPWHILAKQLHRPDVSLADVQLSGLLAELPRLLETWRQIVAGERQAGSNGNLSCGTIKSYTKYLRIVLSEPQVQAHCSSPQRLESLIKDVTALKVAVDAAHAAPSGIDSNADKSGDPKDEPDSDSEGGSGGEAKAEPHRQARGAAAGAAEHAVPAAAPYPAAASARNPVQCQTLGQLRQVLSSNARRSAASVNTILKPLRMLAKQLHGPDASLADVPVSGLLAELPRLLETWRQVVAGKQPPGSISFGTMTWHLGSLRTLLSEPQVQTHFSSQEQLQRLFNDIVALAAAARKASAAAAVRAAASGDDSSTAVSEDPEFMFDSDSEEGSDGEAKAEPHRQARGAAVGGAAHAVPAAAPSPAAACAGVTEQCQTLGQLRQVLLHGGSRSAASAGSTLTPLNILAKQLHGPDVSLADVPLSGLLAELPRLLEPWKQIVIGQRVAGTSLAVGGVQNYASSLCTLLSEPQVQAHFSSPQQLQRLMKDVDAVKAAAGKVQNVCFEARSSSAHHSAPDEPAGTGSADQAAATPAAAAQAAPGRRPGLPASALEQLAGASSGDGANHLATAAAQPPAAAVLLPVADAAAELARVEREVMQAFKAHMQLSMADLRRLQAALRVVQALGAGGGAARLERFKTDHAWVMLLADTPDAQPEDWRSAFNELVAHLTAE